MEEQESTRKDMEQTFGVLKRCWQVLQAIARSYEVKTLQHIMYWHDDLFDKSDEDLDMFIKDSSKNSDGDHEDVGVNHDVEDSGEDS